jgi:multiple sugar transport system substrate-binding protein
MSVRRRTVLAAAAAVLGITATTAAPGLTAGEEVTISFLTHWPPETVELLEAAATAFSEENPGVTVEIQAVPFGDLLTTVRAQAGGGDAPTIAGIYDLWLPELVRDGIVAAAPEAVASDVPANWPAGVVTAATVDDVLYGIPNEIDLYALNYNTRLFEEAGIDGPPETWDELVTAAEALTVRDGDRITQQGFGLINSWAAGVVHPFASLLASNGGALIGDDGMPALNTPEALETFELYENLVSGVQVTDPTMGTSDANTTGPFLDNFVAGNTAMIIMANWWESTLRTGMGDEAFADIATAPIPVGPSGESASSISYSWMTVVSASADEAEQAAAWDFLAWLNGPDSGPDGASAMGDILMSMGILPTRNSDVEAFSDRLSTPFLEGYVSQLATATPFPIVLGGQEFTEALQAQIEALEFGQTDAAGASETAQSDGESILATAQG